MTLLIAPDRPALPLLFDFWRLWDHAHDGGTRNRGITAANVGSALGDVRVRVDRSGVQGWATGAYLVEAAAPGVPETPEGGPVGNGMPFDATGFVNCAATAAEEMRTCPFGVVRDGPGNSGVWIALGGGQERQILFEGGVPVSANADLPLSFDKTGDQFTIRVGDESYEFPEALVNGG